MNRIRSHLASTAGCSLLALLAALPCPAAQDETSDAAPNDLIEQIREHDSRTERRRVGLLGLRLSYPQRVAGSLGAIWVRQPADFDCATVCDFRGPFAQIEPGLAGVQLGAGYAVLVGEKGRNTHYLRRIYVGLGVKGTLLRTWGDAPVNPPDQTFAGVEVNASIAQVNFRLGMLRSLSDPASGEHWLVTGGLGWGF
jgi:hypothetical protein